MSGIIATMSTGNPLIHTSTYQVQTPVYEGPLDLLLRLIERAELDITNLALAQVTDQYLAYLENLTQTDAEDVSAFLVVAARLIQIKSEMLLPRPVVREEGEEDAGEALARQLRIYRQFKKIADWLAVQESSGLRTYLRLAPPRHVETSLDLEGIDVNDLMEMISALLLSEDHRTDLGTVVTAPKITIREKIHHISRYLNSMGYSTFRLFLPDRPTRLEVVVTFLALLELIKRAAVIVEQEALFSDIGVHPSSTWDEDEAFELEFGE
jgi:segregation and condensation protein A